MKRVNYSISDGGFYGDIHESQTTLHSLPSDIFPVLFAFLPPQSLYSISLVSKSWKQLLSCEVTWQYLFYAHYPHVKLSSNANCQESYKKQFLFLQNIVCGIYSLKQVVTPPDVGRFTDFFNWDGRLISEHEDNNEIMIWNWEEPGEGKIERRVNHQIKTTTALLHEKGKLYGGIQEKVMVLDLNSGENTWKPLLDLGANKRVHAISIQKDKLCVSYRDSSTLSPQRHVLFFDLLKNRVDCVECLGDLDAESQDIVCILFVENTVISIFVTGKIEMLKCLTKEKKTYEVPEEEAVKATIVEGKLIIGFVSGNIGVTDITETDLRNDSLLKKTIACKIIVGDITDIQSQPDCILQLCNIGEGYLGSLSANGKIRLWNLRTQRLAAELREMVMDDEDLVENHLSPMTYDKGQLTIGNPVRFHKDNSKGCLSIFDFNVTLNACLEEIAGQLSNEDEALQHDGWRRFKRLPENVKQKIYQSFSNDPERAQLFKASQKKAAIIKKYLVCG